MPFKILPEFNPTTGGLSTEAPTEQGQIQQKMRWNDALQTQVYARQAAMDNHSIRMLEQMDKMLERGQMNELRLAAENMEAFTIVKELLNERANGQHTRVMEQQNYQRETNERSQLLKFAPVLINTILGKEIFPQSTADTALIETIAENVDDVMIGKLAEAGLPPVLMGPLSARIMKAIEEKEKRENASSKVLPAYAGSAEQDINGGS